MDNLGVKIVSGSEQYILYCVYCNKRKLGYYGFDNILTIYYPTLEMATNVSKVLFPYLEKFYIKFKSMLDYKVIKGIDRTLFTKINDNELMNSQGDTINISVFIKNAEELMKYKYHDNLPKNYYDEYMLAILRHTDALPMIKNSFSLNPFKPKYTRTDEKTVREMKLVIEE